MEKLIFLRSRRAIRMRLQIDREGKVTLTAPWFASENSIQFFLARHELWLKKHLGKIEAQRRLRPAPRYIKGDVFYYFGEPLELDVIPSIRVRPTVRVVENQLSVTLHKTISKSAGVAAARKAIESFYRKKAEEVIHDRLQFFNEYYGFRYHRVTLRDQKSRWGSCSRAGNLNFNWRLIMAPIEVIDYVVIHELCHLKEMNHSRRFWALVEEKAPNYKVLRKWLREKQILLQT